MSIRMTSTGLPAALLAASLFGACQNTARGLEQDTENNAFGIWEIDPNAKKIS